MPCMDATWAIPPKRLHEEKEKHFFQQLSVKIEPESASREITLAINGINDIQQYPNGHKGNGVQHQTIVFSPEKEKYCSQFCHYLNDADISEKRHPLICNNARLIRNPDKMKTSGHYRNMVHNPCCILCFRRNIQFCFKEIEPHSFQYEADKYRYCKMYQKTHGINPRDSVMIAFFPIPRSENVGWLLSLRN